ncbi:MFS transporter [Croceicoccus bisphenolivorans]|uniref:MFS transporter n=1 Tax=Croceicoccus bisphenolivorans TaxID=1783232 RepID=UPI00082EC5D5|nr:MFS transporter [Croceicoccus bisphenolivorans]
MPTSEPAADKPPATSLPPGALATALVVAVAAFLQMLDSSIITPALPMMGVSFGVTPVEVGIGIMVYVLAAAVMIPASAWLADTFGAKRVFILALLGFTGASLLCGLSANLEMFVGARALQGVSGALMTAIGQLILVGSVDRSSLLRLLNISSIPMLVAPVLGPPLGGFLTELWGWEWIFYINIPIGLFGAVAASRVLGHLPIRTRPFDLPGFLLNGTALSLLLFGLEQLADPQASRAITIAILAGGIVAAVLAIRHLRRSAHPILSLAPFRLPTFRISVGTTLPLIRVPIHAFLFVLPIMLQVGFGMSAVQSGVALLGHAAGDLLMKPLMTRTFRRFSYRKVLLFTTAVMSIGIGGCGFITAATPFALIIAIAFVSGCARSFVMTGLTSLAYDEIAPAQVPSAVTLTQIVVQVAAGLAIALSIILFDVSAMLTGASRDAIGAVECSYVFWVVGLLGLLSLPALARLSKTAGDQMSGRVPKPAAIEE